MEKDAVIYLYNLELSSPKDTLCQVWLKLTQRDFWRRKCEKFTTTTTTDNGQIMIRKTHSSFLLGLTKNLFVSYTKNSGALFCAITNDKISRGYLWILTNYLFIIFIYMLSQDKIYSNLYLFKLFNFLGQNICSLLCFNFND